MTMDLQFYRFTDTWDLDQHPDAVFAALTDPEHFPDWWWGFRKAVRIDGDTVEFTIRSALPYSLLLRQSYATVDDDRRYGRVELGGDLVGWFEVTVTEQRAGSRVEFVQETRANKPLLRLLAPIARPAFRYNHNLMMRRGQAGLRRRLSGA